MRFKTISLSVLAVVIVTVAAAPSSSFDKIINSRGSLFLNFDADNNDAGELLLIATDTASDLGGMPLLSVNDDGHVGIGTDTPEHVLDVRGDAGDEVRIGSPDGVPMLHFRNFSTGKDWVIRHDEDFLHVQDEAAPGTEVVTLRRDGRLGIGTTDPTHPLHVYSDLTNNVLKLESGDPNVGITFREPGSVDYGSIAYSGEVMKLGTGAGELMRIEPNGNVGIGTTTPVAALTIPEGERISLDDNADDRAIYVPTGEGEPLVITNSRQAANPTIRFRDDTDGTDAMVVDVDTGNVSIPAGDLVVEDPAAAYRGNIGPNGGAPFPRPAWDSGWESVDEGTSVVLTHNIGGDPDNYVVDMQFRSQYPATGTHVREWGTNSLSNDQWRGANWESLTNTTIKVYRGGWDDQAHEIRIRIWVYN